MFDIGWTELLVVAVVAIIVVGPKDLPGMLRTLGRYAGKLKRTAGEFRAQFDDALRDSELDELRSTMHDVGDLNPVGQIRDSVTESLNPLKDTAEDIKGGIQEATGSAAAGRMKTDAKPSASGSSKSGTKTSAKPAAKKKASKPATRAAAKPKAKPKKKTASAGSGG